MSQGERLDDLTAREREVLDLVRLGLTNEEIAGRLSITQAGVKYHVSQILSKLGVATREEAVAVAIHVGEAFQPRRSRWWAALPLVARAAGVAIILAGVAGLGVLAWGVIETSDPADERTLTPETPGRSAVTSSRAGTIDDLFYDIALAVPGFAGLASNERNDGFLVFMAEEEADPESVRASILQVVRDLPSSQFSVERFETLSVELVPVQYDWTALYEWYQVVRGTVPGAILSDIDEARNKLRFGISGDNPDDASDYLRDAGIPDDAFVIETGVEFGVDDQGVPT